MDALNRLLSFFLLLSLTVSASYAQTKADSLAIMNAVWKVNEDIPGIISKEANFTDLYGGAQHITLLEVDIHRHHLSILSHDGRQLTTENAIRREALGAVNGTYFDMGASERSVCYIAVDGKVIDYTLEDLGLRTNGAVILGKRNVKIVPWDVSKENDFRPGKKSVMSCGPLMVQKGREVDMGPNPDSHIPQPNPRSGIAVLSNHRVLLMVVDGRQKGKAEGITVPQFAHLSRILGARSALNLDGGGSSVLWTKNKGILNYPSDGKERTVSNSILVH